MATAGEGDQLRLAIRSAAAVGETFFGLLHVGRLVSTFMATGGIYMQTERRPQLCSRLTQAQSQYQSSSSSSCLPSSVL